MVDIKYLHLVVVDVRRLVNATFKKIHNSQTKGHVLRWRQTDGDSFSKC